MPRTTISGAASANRRNCNFPSYVLYLRQVAKRKNPAPSGGTRQQPPAGEDQGGCGENATADTSVEYPNKVNGLKQVITGFFNYHAVPTKLGCAGSLWRAEITERWRRTLSRRSAKKAVLGWARIRRSWRTEGSLQKPRPRRAGIRVVTIPSHDGAIVYCRQAGQSNLSTVLK